jgi:hypothetical protein
LQKILKKDRMYPGNTFVRWINHPFLSAISVVPGSVRYRAKLKNETDADQMENNI